MVSLPQTKSAPLPLGCRTLIVPKSRHYVFGGFANAVVAKKKTSPKLLKDVAFDSSTLAVDAYVIPPWAAFVKFE